MQVGVAESNHTHLWLLSDMFTIGETGVAMGTLFKPLCLSGVGRTGSVPPILLVTQSTPNNSIKLFLVSQLNQLTITYLTYLHLTH